MNPQESDRSAIQDNKGRFIKGNNANPRGTNQFTTIVPLIAALEKAGERHGQPFFDMVAEKCYSVKNESLLIAVLKKILPDQIKGEGFETNITTAFFGEGVDPERRRELIDWLRAKRSERQSV